MANIVDGGFQGVVTPVNRSGGVVRSMRAVRDIDELEEAPDLVVIAVPAAEVADIVSQAVGLPAADARQLCDD